MEHEEAIEMRAVERHVLGELSVSEVEEFERHFFDCSQCSEELRTLSILQDNARAMWLEQSPAPVPVSLPATEPSNIQETGDQTAGRAGWRRFWFQWAPAMAGIVVALFAGYEFGARRAGDTPQPITAFPLYSASRGEETTVTPGADAKFYSLYLDKTWDQDFVSYRAEFRDDSGSRRFSIVLPPPPSGRAIYILTPAHALPAGKYVLAIMGTDQSGKETEAARYPFTLAFK